MIIKFSSDILKITFEEHEPYPGRSIIMKGEALDSGFDAALSSMLWLPSKDIVSNNDKQAIYSLIQKNNAESDFVIMFMEE